MQANLKITVVGTVLMLFNAPAIAEVAVSGVTYEIKQDGTYTVLPGVEVQAYRRGPILPTPAVSNQNGDFDFAVRNGQPFTVVFFGPDKVPEMQLLAGKDGVKNVVHVALMTEKQTKTFGISPTKKVEQILDQIRGDDLLSRRLVEYLNRLENHK